MLRRRRTVAYEHRRNPLPYLNLLRFKRTQSGDDSRLKCRNMPVWKTQNFDLAPRLIVSCLFAKRRNHAKTCNAMHIPIRRVVRRTNRHYAGRHEAEHR